MSSSATTLPWVPRICAAAQFPFWTMATCPSANSAMESASALDPTIPLAVMELFR